ncbi:hypothetical protein KGF56_004247 [Candida oxycetoniae]|uniref:Ubiquitin ligase-binding protein BUL2 n=1 Tax=Candida oxycetoniae TaxID=497107 RepID=A0AAI9WWR2_9ASCO|nr:uncharacterized protein KGF56_004247 [Candida oxycetoniae]KAI3402994.2 hypothetical protein KGF56_004247 [Candida oxycetoniae]
MYTSTVGLKATVPENTQDQDLPPPNYDSTQSYVTNSPNLLTPTTTPGSVLIPSSESLGPHISNTPSFDFAQLTETAVSPAVSPASAASAAPAAAPAPAASLIVTDEFTWKETILDNVHRMPNMTFEDHVLPKSVTIDVFYTKDIGEINKVPEMIDPSLYEYKQGDLLNGYIIIRNTSNKPIPFEMFYLLFEGNFTVANPANFGDPVPVKIQRFLEMFDFYGSWNDAHINRLVTETEDIIYGGDDDPTDPLDGSHLYFVPNKQILPNRTYKRFFSFRIPNNLLDSVCNEHNLSKHVELPPTIGLPRFETAHFPEREKTKIRDLGILHTSVSYGVMARFIGKKSTWEKRFGKFETPKQKDNAKLVNSKGDEYIILKELTNYVRVVAETKIPTQNEKLMKEAENKLLYENLVKQIQNKIDLGNNMIKAVNEHRQIDCVLQSNEIISQQDIDAAKTRQHYFKRDIDSIRDIKTNLTKIEYYHIFIQLVKKTLTSGTKNVGVLSVRTPKRKYHINYIPPTRFRDAPIKSAPSWVLDIPVDFSVANTRAIEKLKLPQIKSISAELVVHTIKSMNKPIALELNHDLVYNKCQNNCKESVDKDTFTNNIIRPFTEQAIEINHILKTLGVDKFKVEKQLIDDLKSICQLKEKTMNLMINELKVDGEIYNPKNPNHQLNWSVNENNAVASLNEHNASASLNLTVNLQRMSMKGIPLGVDKLKSYDLVNLVPNFQSCYIARFYHICLKFSLGNGVCARIKVPVVIDKIDRE